MAGHMLHMGTGAVSDFLPLVCLYTASSHPAPSTGLLCSSGWVLKMLGIQESPCALTLISLSPGDWNPQSRSRNRG